MEKLYKRPGALLPLPSGYCPGCMHSTVAKVIADALQQLGQEENTIMVLPVGCSTMSVLYYKLDMVVSAHGRAPAVATGVKATRPEQLVITYQGDGDLAAIGLAEIMSAANRGEHFTTIFVNNSIYGMTGGQMAPTTLIGQKSTTSIYGRDPSMGYPMHMAELIASLEAPYYVERCAVNTPSRVVKATASVKKALQYQLEGRGFSFIEVLSNCPTNWGMSPVDTLDFIENTTSKEFSLGVLRDRGKEAAQEVAQ
ncbi:MAG: thiamine pyrophosphate-dependent enzyme [Peptoniphilaceae bacterium]|nr:thiamine pyrophosphate-dependent enzyme [Peptoniphilaceae bacterium]MCI6659912.1 thiamine pyrophosphate-dependent enzyme [Peptoniphilaceae bacterium]MDD7433751.1 thiamine pyrophosphate-dependent enzyme [Peptoniphilaceae bacterium]MDD7543376.1 thiamine pyrophosphate-dependent enzyme [Peptoniphilaceae bacterium]MDY3075586.1 thiamine pyrophosphate-dependent enzyme [Peptoniphilaceae bacterium]